MCVSPKPCNGEGWGKTWQPTLEKTLPRKFMEENLKRKKIYGDMMAIESPRIRYD